ncbi:hypothetical protein GCM10009589_34160 [Arthrobacter pascens]
MFRQYTSEFLFKCGTVAQLPGGNAQRIQRARHLHQCQSRRVLRFHQPGQGGPRESLVMHVRSLSRGCRSSLPEAESLADVIEVRTFPAAKVCEGPR